MEAWVLILWLAIDRGGGPAAAEFSSKERCEAAGEAFLKTPRFRWRNGGTSGDTHGNFVCVKK